MKAKGIWNEGSLNHRKGGITMRKPAFILATSICGLSLISCMPKQVSTTHENTPSNPVITQPEEIPEEVQVASDELPVDSNDLPWTLILSEPDYFGDSYLNGTFTNHSEFPIITYSLTLLNKQSNETIDLSSYDTVMPGETSPKFTTFEKMTEEPVNHEVLKLEVGVVKTEKIAYNITYDFKLERAEWYEYEY